MTDKTNGDLRVCHVNCQSLFAHIDVFRNFFGMMDCHIICLSETWLRPGITDAMVRLPGYSLYRCDRLSGMGGGVAFYLADHLAASILCSSETATRARPEYIVAEIAANYRSRLLLAVVYRPPNTGYLNEFFQRILELQVNYRYLIIFGDFNADMMRDTFDSQQMNSFITAAGLYCVPYKPTHHLRNSSTLLDLCIIDDEEKLVEYGQHGAAFLSAHDLINIKYDIEIKRRSGRHVVCRDWRNFDIDSFRADVNKMDWTNLITSDNIDEKIEIFNYELLKVHVPLRERYFKHLPAPWLTSDIKSAMRDRDLARRAWRRHRNDDNYNLFKSLRNGVQSMVRQAKQEYYENIFNCTRNANEIWKGLRHLGLIRNRNSGARLSCTVEELNRFFTDGEAELFSVGSDLSEDFFVGNFDDSSFYWSHVTPLEIRRAILRTTSNAVGMDGVSLLLLKLTMDSVMPILEHIFNFSLQFGCSRHSGSLRLFDLSPKLKTRHLVRIIGLPTLSKALERVVYEQIRGFLEDAKLLDPCQFAYRSDHSTQACIVSMLDGVRHAADRRMVTVSVFFDFSKAFDRVDHYTLIGKLKDLNFSCNALRWIHSYLTERTQAVRDTFDDTLSSFCPVTAGLPQGSVLGPLLFTLYLLDFGRVPRHCKYSFYADDLQVYMHCEPRDLVEAIFRINEDIEAIQDWSLANDLLLNSGKTQAIIVGTSRYINAIDLTIIPKIRVNGAVLQYSTSVRYLGVTIMNTLSWEMQAMSIARRVHSVLYQLKLCKHLLPEALRARLVVSLIFPHVDYCCVAYTDMTGEQNLKLYRAVNSCIRFIYNVKKDEHITPYYRRLGWLKIDARRTYFVGCLMYRILQAQQPSLLFAFFSGRVPSLG